MTQVLFFPANKLAATITPIFNGHKAIVSLNTDRLIDKKHELAEIGLFRHNLQGTSFLNPFGVSSGENANYAQLLQDAKTTGRIGLGLYYRTDYWVNPKSGKQELIPDYNSAVWTAAGVAAFKNAVFGNAKGLKTPNHGQQMYDLSAGEYGYDFVGQKYGASGASETFLHTELQTSYFKKLANIIISAGSYANGAQAGAKLHIPNLLGLRNSIHSGDGNGDIQYKEMQRVDMISKASTTRTWDAAAGGQFENQQASLAYTQAEIQRAINNGGWFSDFMHWHSLYNTEDTKFFDTFFAACNQTIGSQDVWRASNAEVYEYFVLSKSINKIGSYVHNNAAFVSVRFNDVFIGSNTDGIPNQIDPLQIQTPLSILCDFSGTNLAGKILTSKQAVHCRQLSNDQWVFNVLPIASYKNGYLSFKIEEATNADKTFTTEIPLISVAENSIVKSDMPVKIVIWAKPKGSADTEFKALFRSDDFKQDTSYAFNTASFDYIIGAISRSRNSAAITYP